MSDYGEIQRRELDTSERLRQYLPTPEYDVPPTRSDPQAMHQYARQLERYVELRDRQVPYDEPDFLDRHPRIARAITLGALALLVYAVKRIGNR